MNSITAPLPPVNQIHTVGLVYSRELSDAANDDYWLTTNKLKYRFHIDSTSVYSITIDMGYPTDGASNPRPLWFILPPTGRHTAAVVVHDKLCNSPWVVNETTGYSRKLSNKQVDEIFLAALKASGVSKITRNLAYAGVRLWDILGFRSKNVNKRRQLTAKVNYKQV